MESPPADTGIPAPAVEPVAQRPVHGGYAKARSLHFSAATYSALIGLILLVAGLVLYVYYYERMLDRIFSRNHDFDELVSLTEIAKFSIYARMFGYVAVVLALVLTVQGVIVRQRSGGGHGPGLWSSLSPLKYLLIIALVLAAATAISYVYLAEVENLDMDDGSVYRLVSRVISYSSLLAWILATIGLITVANRMSNLPPAPRAPTG